MPCDYKEYPADWKSKVRPDILERDNNACKFCGVVNHRLINRNGKGISDWVYWPEGMESEAWTLDGLKSTLVVLTIAHLDHDKTNNNYENLAALCQRCHLKHDIKHHGANRKYGRNHKGEHQMKLL